MRESNGRQVPWESSSLVGDFYFVPPGDAEPANPHSSIRPSEGNAIPPSHHEVPLAPRPLFSDQAAVAVICAVGLFGLIWLLSKLDAPPAAPAATAPEPKSGPMSVLVTLVAFVLGVGLAYRGLEPAWVTQPTTAEKDIAGIALVAAALFMGVVFVRAGGRGGGRALAVVFAVAAALLLMEKEGPYPFLPILVMTCCGAFVAGCWAGRRRPA
jgi:hypothetical protein